MKKVSVDEHITVEAQVYSIKDNSEFKPEGSIEIGKQDRFCKSIIIATNGIISKKIHFIAFNNNSILCAVVTGQNRHVIIHSDRSLHVKQDDVKNAEHLDQPKNRSFKPLSDFKNSFRVASYTFTNDIAKIPTPNYSKKKSKKSLICPIDVRNYPPNNQIVCDVNLVEPERYDLIEAIKPPDCKKFLYSHFVPWIVISVYAFDLN